MVSEKKKTAAKKVVKKGSRKPNPTTDKKQKSAKPAGKGTKSQTDKAKKAGVKTAAKKLNRNTDSKEKSPPKKR
jgi:hypothetical protein